MNFFHKIYAVWQKVSVIQKALLTGVLLTFILVSVVFTKWAKQPDFAVLFSNLAVEEAAKITDKLSEKSIPYELRNGGTAVYAPRKDIYQLRADLAKEGLPGGSRGGYKLFDDEKIGTSPFVQGVNLQRALQDELANSIQMIEGIDHARVHIVKPQNNLFKNESQQTTASVVLRLRPGVNLSPGSIAAITRLVAGSVEGLKSENVTVVDGRGNLLSGNGTEAIDNGASMVADYKERVERNLEKKVEDMLTAAIGAGRVSVKVSAVVNTVSTKTTRENYDKKNMVPTKEESSSNSEVAAAGNGNEKKDKSNVTEYAVGKTVEQVIQLAGGIESLSVAAFVDLSPRITADMNDTAKAEALAKGKIMQITDVEQIIRTALGLTEKDTIKVVETTFAPPKPVEEVKASPWPMYLGIAKNASLGIMAVCALLALRIFAKSAGAADTAEQSQSAAAGVSAGQPAMMPMQSMTGVDQNMLRKQISAALQSNPAAVRQLFSSWIQEK